MVQREQAHKQILKGIGRDVFSNIPNPARVAAKGLRRKGTAVVARLIRSLYRASLAATVGDSKLS